MKNLTKLALILALVFIIGVLPAAAQDAPAYPEDTITVQGFGSASGLPDIANLEIGVETIDTDILAAYTQNNDTVQAVIDALVEAGIAREDIRTVNLSIFREQFPQQPPMPNESGMQQEQPQGNFRVNNMVRITVRDINNIATVIDAAVDAGATNVFGLSFGIEERDTLESEARTEAMADARERAEELAALMEVELGEIIIVNEGGGGFGPFDVRNMSMPMAQGGGGAPIEPGTLSVNINVQVTFRINR